MVKSNSRRVKHKEFENFRKTQGKHREFENFKVEIRNQESIRRKNCCLMSIVSLLMFKMSFFYENTQLKLKLYRENSGNFTFQDEWEPWIDAMEFFLALSNRVDH